MREQGGRFASKGVLVAGGQDNPVVGAKLASKKLVILSRNQGKGQHIKFAYSNCMKNYYLRVC